MKKENINISVIKKIIEESELVDDKKKEIIKHLAELEKGKSNTVLGKVKRAGLWLIIKEILDMIYSE